MMKRLFFVLVLLALTVPLSAQWRYVANVPDITVAATAIGITDSYVNGQGHVQANVGSCIVSTAEVRYTIDGTTPTSSYGYVAGIGAQIPLDGNDIVSAFRAIRTGSTSALLSCVVAAQ